MAYPDWTDLPGAIYIALALIVVSFGAPLIRWMLAAASAQGGHRAGNAADYALQVVAQSEAFRADVSVGRVPWDGVPRLTGVEGNDGGG